MPQDSNGDAWISISLDVFKRAPNNHAKIVIYNLETMESVFEIDQDLLTYEQLNFHHDIRHAFSIFLLKFLMKTKQKIFYFKNFKAYLELSIHHTKIQSFFFDMLEWKIIHHYVVEKQSTCTNQNQLEKLYQRVIQWKTMKIILIANGQYGRQRAMAFDLNFLAFI